MPQHIKNTLRKTNRQPRLQHIAKAVNYCAVFEDVGHFFDKANMPQVSRHLVAARNEIALLWQTYNEGTVNE